MNSKCSQILKCAKPPLPNLPKEEKNAICNLKRDSSILILPADKGNAMVMINTCDY